MLEVRNLTFSYPKIPTPVLKNISFTLEAGQILTILGPNGAGKSTLLNCLAGLLTPQQGTVLLNGDELALLNAREVACRLGYVRQSINTDITFSVREFVYMGCTPHLSPWERPGSTQLAAADTIIEQMGLTPLADKNLCDISGGERQQAMIAQVLVQNPQIILFDEPTSHLDYGNQLKVLQRIADLADAGYAIIMTTHDPDQAILLDDLVGVLEKDGTFTVGSTVRTLTPAFLSRVYGLELQLVRLPEQDRLVCLSPDLKRGKRYDD